MDVNVPGHLVTEREISHIQSDSASIVNTHSKVLWHRLATNLQTGLVEPIDHPGSGE